MSRPGAIRLPAACGRTPRCAGGAHSMCCCVAGFAGAAASMRGLRWLSSWLLIGVSMLDCLGEAAEVPSVAVRAPVGAAGGAGVPLAGQAGLGAGVVGPLPVGQVMARGVHGAADGASGREDRYVLDVVGLGGNAGGVGPAGPRPHPQGNGSVWDSSMTADPNGMERIASGQDRDLAAAGGGEVALLSMARAWVDAGWWWRTSRRVRRSGWRCRGSRRRRRIRRGSA